MKFNQDILNKVAATAKAKTDNKRWHAAIDKAVAGLTGAWIVTELAHSIAITTESGHTYFANGSCQCKAYSLGTPCKHRAAARLIELMEEEAPSFYCDCCGAESDAVYDTCPSCGTEGEWLTEDEFYDDVDARIEAEQADITRAELISTIKRIWPATWPPLYTELLARFGKSDLSMLDTDMLRRVRLAISM